MSAIVAPQAGRAAAIESALVHPGRRGRVRELDGLRGIAILLVMMMHGGMNAAWVTSSNHTVMSLPMHAIQVLFSAGWMGVDLFFVLSGFLITGILLDTAGHVHYYRNFIVRRALRIFPLYYVFLLIYFASSPWLLRRDVLWFLTYTANLRMFLTDVWPPVVVLSPLWSMQVEEQFYLTFPWIVLKTTRKMLRRILIGAVIAALLFRGVLALAMPQNALGVYVLMPARMDGLALGGLVAITLRDSPETLNKRFIPMVSAICAILFALIWKSHIPVLVKTFSYTFLDSAFAGVLVLLITNACRPLTAICRWKPLVHIGVISYGLYIVHSSAYFAVNPWSAQFLRLPAGDFLQTMVACALAITIAELSWRFFESPFLKLKDQFTVR